MRDTITLKAILKWFEMAFRLKVSFAESSLVGDKCSSKGGRLKCKNFEL